MVATWAQSSTVQDSNCFSKDGPPGLPHNKGLWMARTAFIVLRTLLVRRSPDMWQGVGGWKCRFLMGWQCHSISFSCKDLRIISWSNCCMASVISLSAPTKLVPLSLQISLAAPQMQIKRRSAWMKASVFNDPTSSTCIALEVRQTKMQP